MLQGVRRDNKGLQGNTTGYRGLQRLIKVYRWLLGVTRGYKGLERYTGVTGSYKGLE